MNAFDHNTTSAANSNLSGATTSISTRRAASLLSRGALLALSAVLLGVMAGCVGAPAELDEEESVGEESQAILPPDEDPKNPISVTVSCSPNYPFVGLVFKNNSTHDIPSIAKVSYTALNGTVTPYTGSFFGPILKGATKTVWVQPVGGHDPLSCTAKANWDQNDI
jgi:hypothetical protein